MATSQVNGGYSAEVRLRLLIGDQRLSLSHVGPDSIRLRHDADIPPHEATVVVSVDGEDQFHRVYLPDGIRPGERNVRVVPVVAE